MSTPPGSVSRGCKDIHTGVADRWYLFMYLLRRAIRNLRFDPPTLGDRPPTGELIAPLYHSLLLLLQPPSLRTQQLWPTGRRSPPSSIIVLWTAFYQAGGGRLSTVPCVRFYIAGGRGQLSTVPCVRFYIEISVAFRGGDGVRYPPPLSGGAKLNNSTCGIKKKSAAPGGLSFFVFGGESE